MVPGGEGQVQEDWDLPDMRQAQERLPDVHARPRIRPASPG